MAAGGTGFGSDGCVAGNCTEVGDGAGTGAAGCTKEGCSCLSFFLFFCFFFLTGGEEVGTGSGSGAGTLGGSGVGTGSGSGGGTAESDVSIALVVNDISWLSGVVTSRGDLGVGGRPVGVVGATSGDRLISDAGTCLDGVDGFLSVAGGAGILRWCCLLVVVFFLAPVLGDWRSQVT